MAGFLSRIFDEHDGRPLDGTLGGVGPDPAQSDDADGGGEGHHTGDTAQSTGGSTETTLDVNPTIAVESEMSGTYYDLDGSETTWSRTDSITLSLNLDATAHVAAGSVQDVTAEG